MSVTRDDVRHIAGLARLGVADDHLDALVRELNGILGHMEVLQQVETGGAARAAEDLRAGMTLRPDVDGAVPLARAREEFGPRMREGFFLVPRLATHDDDAEA
ncbi:MAG: Asp-tRNA(Asn)/Glu-tRNA(Gln) amidotransferase subunit GatC [Gemmatimonadaceae bacterium]